MAVLLPHLPNQMKTVFNHPIDRSLPEKKEVVGHSTKSFLKLNEGRICKPLNEREKSFYERAQNNLFNQFIPDFYGSQRVEDSEYIELRDLLDGIKKPCIADIKIGNHLKEGIVHSPVFIHEEQLKKTMNCTSGQLNFRIVGMQIYHLDTRNFIKKDHSWGRQLSKETVKDGLKLFFNNGPSIRKEVIKMFEEKIQELIKFFQDQRLYRFYSCSLLFVYEGDVMLSPKVEMKMIDFEQAWEVLDGGRDEGFLIGLQNLLSYLYTIQMEDQISDGI